MQANLESMKKIGFEYAGCWKQSESGIVFELNTIGSKHNVLYSFVVEGQVLYIGKSINTLSHRMQRYKTPPKTAATGATTNIKNNGKIRACLDQGKAVEIYAFADNGLLQFGEFHVNLAAGLEDSLVKKVQPQWNGGKKETPQETLEPTANPN